MLRCRRRLRRAEVGRADYDRGRVAATAIADQSGYRAASVTVVVRYRSYYNIVIYRRSLPPRQSSCRDVVFEAVVRRSCFAEISTPRRLPV